MIGYILIKYFNFIIFCININKMKENKIDVKDLKVKDEFYTKKFHTKQLDINFNTEYFNIINDSSIHTGNLVQLNFTLSPKDDILFDDDDNIDPTIDGLFSLGTINNEKYRPMNIINGTITYTISVDYAIDYSSGSDDENGYPKEMQGGNSYMTLPIIIKPSGEIYIIVRNNEHMYYWDDNFGGEIVAEPYSVNMKFNNGSVLSLSTIYLIGKETPVDTTLLDENIDTISVKTLSKLNKSLVLDPNTKQSTSQPKKMNPKKKEFLNKIKNERANNKTTFVTNLLDTIEKDENLKTKLKNLLL